MSLERAKKYLEEKGYADHVIELEESSATVQLAAEALGVEQGIREINLIPFGGSVIANGKVDFDEIINNAIVFIPVGAYFSLLFKNKSALKAIGSVFGISFVYEIIQFIFAIGASDITDLISNTLGGIIGVALVYVLSIVLKDKTHKILNRIAMVCTVLVVIFLFMLLAVNNIF